MLEALVVGNAGGQRQKVDHATPLLLNPVIPFLSFFGPGRPRIFRIPYTFCEYAICDKSGRTLRVGSGEQYAHRTALGCAEQRRALGAHRVHDGSNVIHPLLEGGQLCGLVRKTCPSLIKQNESSERGQASIISSERRVFPGIIYVGYPSRNIDQIDWSISHHLVCNLDIAASGVSRFGSGVRRHRCAGARTARRVASTPGLKLQLLFKSFQINQQLSGCLVTLLSIFAQCAVHYAL